jgi:hypothetical protein
MLYYSKQKAKDKDSKITSSTYVLVTLDLSRQPYWLNIVRAIEKIVMSGKKRKRRCFPKEIQYTVVGQLACRL